jgi:hypothetical protein
VVFSRLTPRPSGWRAAPSDWRRREPAGAPAPRSLFPHRAQFSLVLGHCLLALTQLLLFLEQRFGATMRLMHIRAQYRNSLVKPKMRITGSENRLFLG